LSTEIWLILAVAAITFATRIAFLIKPRPIPEGLLGRFLGVFPLALFVTIAAQGLLAPGGSPEVSPALAAGVGGIVGGIVFRRSLWGVLGVGAIVFYVVRAMST
jgi:branched-subunit amino acid transport protein